MVAFIATTVASACLLAVSAGASTAAGPASDSASSQGRGAVREGVIAFEGSDGLYVIDANGGKARKIAGTLPRDGDPTWSPDGRRIAFDRGGDDRDIYVMDADGSNQRRLTFAPADDGWPQWAPHGRSLTFTSDRDGVYAVYAIDLRRGQARRVAYGAFPDWAQNRRILFTNDNDDLESVRPYGAGRRVDARSTSGVEFFGPRISEDDRMIVFTDGAFAPPGLYTARSDGGDPKLVLTRATEIYNPAWSPDGRWITLSIDVSGERSDIYVVRADGTELTRLTEMAPHATACCSDWSVKASP
jgi:TolB protein